MFSYIPAKGYKINTANILITIEGFVQGVGMRPFIDALARKYRQNGWVVNTAEGLSIALEGDPKLQQEFLDSLNIELPPLASIDSLVIHKKPPAHYGDFRIKTSSVEGSKSVFVLPDIATCRDCLNDIFEPASRFYRYPFTSCSHCGPRYSIMLSQPYDRCRTSMAEFTVCSECAQDYRAVENRRFHAQTIACSNCGPALRLLDCKDRQQAEDDRALITASRYLQEGKIIAVKGIGGYQLLVDAANRDAIERLRNRKHRPYKPFAIMVADVPSARELCQINALEEQALTSHAAPIVLLKRRKGTSIAHTVAPDGDLLGVMLAYSPLHHLLLHDFGAPLVATSGNRQNEPICIDNEQALTQLAGIADYFLVHNRPILRPLDDSIVRLIGDNITVLRRARGYVPLPIALTTKLPDILAVGGQLKSSVAVSHGRQIILSQHLGDLDAEATQCQFEATIADLREFYQIEPNKLMHDLHSGYSSSQFAERQGMFTERTVKTGAVQHHYAHILSCMAEHGLEPPLLGIAWDGSGLGSDNTLWGGEFLLMHDKGFQRFAHFRPFSLPGGYKAIKEPRRSALGLLYEIFADCNIAGKELAFSETELKLLCSALSKQINCPRTTSVGRIFDAVASLLKLNQVNQYEGQAAMALENCAAAVGVQSRECYPFRIDGIAPLVIDWKMMVEQLVTDIKLIKPELIAEKFHNTLSEIILAVALRAEQQNIVLSGGCFQNSRLVGKAACTLKNAGFKVYFHEKIPPNDGGLALGQLYAVNYIG